MRFPQLINNLAYNHYATDLLKFCSWILGKKSIQQFNLIHVLSFNVLSNLNILSAV